jgi:Alanine dehydrogenase
MQIAVPREVRDGETRVAATPDSVKRLVKAGHHVVVETNAGLLASMDDKSYEDAGATIAGDFKSCVKNADLVIKIRRPEASEIKP